MIPDPWIAPTGQRVVVLEEPSPEPESPIIFPNGAEADLPALFGRVVSVGPGRRLRSGARRPVEVKRGELVAFGRYAGERVERDGKAFWFLLEDGLLGVVLP